MNLVVIGGAVIVHGGLLALLGDTDLRQMVFTGFSVGILALIPVLLINLSAKKFASEVSEVNLQLKASKDASAEMKS